MKTIVVAPHPDDEVLGAAGTLLRKKKNGESFKVYLTSSVLYGENGEPTGMMGISRDIKWLNKTYTKYLNENKSGNTETYLKIEDNNIKKA